MSVEPKNKSIAWQPTANIKALRIRAQLLAHVRDFFAKRQVLEVDTPICVQHPSCDTHITHLKTTDGRFLHTSPEFSMKRLLAHGVGSIYQIAKVFRSAESGRWHNPEFSLLEWYRLGFDDQQLMDEIESLIHGLLPDVSIERHRYAHVFKSVLDIDPHQATTESLAQLANQWQLISSADETQRDFLLDLLLTQVIIPQLPNPCFFLTDYPAQQGALAKLTHDQDNNLVAKRFELYIHGIEIANGYDELQDTQEHLERSIRNTGNALDPYFQGALEQGLPQCAGVALGIDRLVMILADAKHINDVLCFPYDIA